MFPPLRPGDGRHGSTLRTKQSFPDVPNYETSRLSYSPSCFPMISFMILG
jgi:hypothetical protein